jgi:hypothetical protein
MEVALGIAIAVLAVLLIVVFAMLVSRQRRRSHLQDRFGGEYQRTLESTDSRRRAERELVHRERQRDELDIRPLSSAARQRYVDEWHAIQSQFVDQPNMATTRADNLVEQVMRERGYPVDEFDTQAALVSVDYPDVVENYRVAHEVSERNDRGEAETEDLRNAMLRYRSLFDVLVESESAHG